MFRSSGWPSSTTASHGIQFFSVDIVPNMLPYEDASGSRGSATRWTPDLDTEFKTHAKSMFTPVIISSISAFDFSAWFLKHAKESNMGGALCRKQ
jgi:hypothetical protein